MRSEDDNNPDTEAQTTDAKTDKPRRRKKPPIDFNILTDRETQLIHGIANNGAKVAMSQQKAREGQLRAMKDSLPDLLEEMGETNPEFVKRFFKEIVAVASVANAKKIAAHPLCPAEITQACRPQ